MSEMRFPDPSEREKRARLLEMLDAGKVMVYVDPRRPGVDLPPQFKGQVAVPLNLSHRFALETFEVGPLAVRASLSFGGERHLCVLPYRAIFGFYGHADSERVVFDDALPSEVLIAEPAAPADADAAESAEGVDAGPAEEAPEPSAPPASGRPGLRLVE